MLPPRVAVTLKSPNCLLKVARRSLYSFASVDWPYSYRPFLLPARETSVVAYILTSSRSALASRLVRACRLNQSVTSHLADRLAMMRLRTFWRLVRFTTHQGFCSDGPMDLYQLWAIRLRSASKASKFFAYSLMSWPTGMLYRPGIGLV